MQNSIQRKIAPLCCFTLYTFAFLLMTLIKIPSAFQSFWAEDGAFYGQAIRESFPNDVFISGGGYIIFVSRILSNLVSLFPVYHAAFTNTIILCLILAFLAQRIYVNLLFAIQSSLYRALISLSIFLLPINNFETVASGTALHFILLFVVLVICLSSKQTKSIVNTDIFVVAISLLSDPFTILSLIPLSFARPSFLKDFWRRRKSVLLIWSFSFLVQVLMIYVFYTQNLRKLSESPSILKVVYLFLDRVIGSTLVPGWGHVSSDLFSKSEFSLFLLVRGLSAFLILLFLIFTAVKLSKKSKSQHQNSTHWVLLYLFVVPTFYWCLAGLLVNPEPRYAVFPGLSLLVVVFYLLENTTRFKQRALLNRLITISISSLVIVTWLSSISPSDRRVNGVSWQNEVVKARLECQSAKLESTFLRILPRDHGWSVEMKCLVLYKSERPNE